MGKGAAPLLDISQGWKFRTGDQADWSKADLDDSGAAFANMREEKRCY